jgi:hypothetical protein
MSKQPLVEVFGFPVDCMSKEATRYRTNRLCPYNNKVPSCTKDKANDPLGVCSIFEDGGTAITCPVRFRQNWLIAEDAAAFFFSKEVHWTSLTEIRLNDKHGKTAGNIDIVLVSYDKGGKIIDFGALEVQGVYISGNIRLPFEFYMKNPQKNYDFDWSHGKFYPRPDYLSSSRKRLVPQLLYKGGILKAWNKKVAVALQKGFFETLPDLPEVKSKDADIAWIIYDLELDRKNRVYNLVKHKIVYTMFNSAIDKIINPDVGPIEIFVENLQEKLNDKLDNEFAPDAPTLLDILEK